MMKKTAATLLTLPFVCALANAAPEVYSNFDLNYDIGLFQPDFRFSSFAAPLVISLAANEQAPLDLIGQVPENAIALNYYAQQVSGDIGYKWLGGDDFYNSNITFVEGPTVTVHYEAYPDTESDFHTPAQLFPGDVVGPSQPVMTEAQISANPTAEFGFDDYWFVPDRFIIGVVEDLGDGNTRYGFVEFENISQPAMERDYQPVRWGYETDPNTAFVIPEDCGLADTNRDNTLNFFDVSIFLTAYTDNRFAADLNLDGEVNFFDVSAFLNAFNAGCP